MKNSKLFLFLLLINTLSFGQMIVNQPIEGAIYQRNQSGNGNIAIAGFFTDSGIATVQARLVYTNTQTPVPNFDWITIQSSANFGHIFGTLQNVPAGWYTLQLRGVSAANAILQSATVNRVGIGEVFVVAGQSNAQGYNDYGAVNAQDERVKSVNSTTFGNTYPSYPALSTIEYTHTISNSGKGAWAYGKLGDLLTSRLGVPVVFFNSGVEGSSIQNWKDGADGIATNNPFTGWAYGATNGLPYLSFKKAINYYGNLFGTRSVLWHQGETDHFFGTSMEDYQQRLTYIINKSRSDFNSNLSWMISRVTWDSISSGSGGSGVKGGQNATVQNVANVFYGPDTDGIQPRKSPDENGNNVHFEGARLVTLANEWDAYLNANFFSNSTPILPIDLPQIAISCNAASATIDLAAPTGYAAYKWIRVDNGNYNYEQTAEATTRTITRISGKYLCYLVDNNSNLVLSNTVDVGLALSYCPPINNCTGTTTYLSDVAFVSSTNEGGQGPVERDMSVGGGNANDGGAITLNGVVYSKGLGTHANSEVVISLTSGNYDRFKADIGLNDYITNPACGEVIFKVYGDNTLLYESPAMNALSSTQSIDVSVVGYTTLKLVADPNGVFYCDHADWADARLTTLGVSLAAPVISVNKTTINSNEAVIFTASNCSNSGVLLWSDNVIAINPYQKSFATSTIFSAKCTSNGCESDKSNEIAVTVIPDCQPSYSFVSTANDFSGINTTLSFQASDTISGANKIQNQATIHYKAANSITLSPGFVAENGTVFQATITNCPNN